MPSAFSEITGALVALLEAAPPLVVRVYRARDRPIPEGADSALNVQFDGGVPDRGAIKDAPVDWRSRFTIECYARTAAGAPDEAVDPLIVGVYERLAADTTLGGLVDDIEGPMIEADYSSDGKKTGWVRMTYAIAHRTNNLLMRLA